jgi:predicted SAM-dependent methyltransferase
MEVPYSALSQGRREAFDRFGTVYNLPVIPSAYGYLKQHYQSGLVLDVGAGIEHHVQQILELDDQAYHSLDNDASGHFTYSDTSEIPPEQRYQWILLNQVLEHLTIEETADLLSTLRDHLEEGGTMLITVPNVSHPTRYWADPTHVTHWSYGALYAICRVANLHVSHIYRYSKHRGPLDPLSWIIERFMRHLYQIDWCQSILLTATR